MSALFFAVARHHILSQKGRAEDSVKCISALIGAGADVGTVDKARCCAYGALLVGPCILCSSFKGCLDATQGLLHPPLFRAHVFHTSLARRRLQMGATLLHMACLSGLSCLVSDLIQKGHDVNTVEKVGSVN